MSNTANPGNQETRISNKKKKERINKHENFKLKSFCLFIGFFKFENVLNMECFVLFCCGPHGSEDNERKRGYFEANRLAFTRNYFN